MTMMIDDWCDENDFNNYHGKDSNNVGGITVRSCTASLQRWKKDHITSRIAAVCSACLLAAFLFAMSSMYQVSHINNSVRELEVQTINSWKDQYLIPICFVTAQFTTSAKRADKLFNPENRAVQLSQSPAVKFFAFTNLEDLEVPGWNVIVKDFGTQYKRFITQSRWPKFQGFKDPIIQQECKVVFYIDGNIVPKGSLMSFQNEARRILNSDVKLSQYKHSEPDNNPEWEFVRIIKHRKDIKENVRKSIQWLRSQPDYSLDCQMYENNRFGYAIDSKEFKDAANFFWDHYSKEEDSWRDQPLWCYSLHRQNTVPLEIPKSLWKVEFQRSGIGGHKYTESTNENALLHVKRKQRKESGVMNILCTVVKAQITWGSYRIRCEDLKTWSKQCAPGVNITTGYSIEQILEMDPKQHDFDSTMLVKKVPASSRLKTFPESLGDIYIDLVDDYTMESWMIPRSWHVITQTSRQKSIFPQHGLSVVEHWYNSYPSDMTKQDDEQPDHPIPTIKEDNTKPLRMASVWNVVGKKGRCPALPYRIDEKSVTYDCINQEFNISDWYLDVVGNTTSAIAEMETIMANPNLGSGRLYYSLFQKYDVLVALAKHDPLKLKYGNIQRIVSQMRSGVPVLVEVKGAVLSDFVNQYPDYPCIFQRHEDVADASSGAMLHSALSEDDTSPASSSFEYPTFEQAIIKMKDPYVRKLCQQMGLEIAKDYSPNIIGKKFLKVLGYQGEFQC
jgi:hypothetical protein